MDPLSQIRASDFVILTGTIKTGPKAGQTYEFAKLDSRCPLANNKAFIDALKTAGTRVVAVA